MESLLNFQNELMSRIAKARVNFKKSPKDRLNKQYLEGKLDSVDQLWLEFMSGHKELRRNYDSKLLNKTDYIENDTYDKTEEIYFDYKCELKSMLAKYEVVVNPNKNTATSTDTKSSHIKLPKINLPNFSGNYAEWTTFRDLFRSLILQNESLDNVQKLHYLKGYLVGEAEQLLRHIPIETTNFDRCWKLLEERYNNKKFICHHVLKRLLSQKNSVVESASGLKELVDTTNDCLATLANLGIEVKSWDVIIIHILTLKLDSETRRQWEFHITSNTPADELPTYEQFKEFLTKRFRAIEFLDPKSTSGYKGQSKPDKIKSLHVTNASCPFCTEAHKLTQCKSFQKETVEARRNFVLNNNVCFNCMGSNHSAKECRTNLKCRMCKRNHHSLLHPGVSTSNKPENKKNLGATAASSEGTKSSNIASTSGVVSCFATGRAHQQVLLATALVKAIAKSGEVLHIRALLDQGSQASFVTESTTQYLGLKKTPITGQVTGLGGNKDIVSKAMVTLEIQSRIDPNVKIPVKAYVLQHITSLLPTKRVEAIEWAELSKLVLADPEYFTPNRVDLLLGAEVYSQILQNGLKRGPPGTPVAQSTSLGWIVSGVVNACTDSSSPINVMHCCTNDNRLLRKFWELESDVQMPKEMMFTDEEKRCEQHFAETTRRDEQGRYVVSLPLNTATPDVTGSLGIAGKRLKSLEYKLGKNTSLQLQYQKGINEYIELKHMEIVPEGELTNPKAVYLPHHAVVREDKDTTKVRVVFDASCKGTNNKSLNDHLLVGPTLQADLKHLVMRWRVSRICLTADVVKMYRQIKVNEADVDLQRILWRNYASEEIKHYRMLRVTFGVASAPYLAVKVLQQLSEDEGQEYPCAAKALLNNFYMDDLLAGCENEEEGIKLYRELNDLVGKAGFTLQKWSSNSEYLLQKMKEIEMGKNEEKVEEIKHGLKIKTDEVLKIVGLTWNRSDDSFRYKVEMLDTKKPETKRSIISKICRFYDPLGWVGPSIIVSKIMIQKLWLAGLDWDETVPEHILKEWQTYQEELKILTNVSIPRWIGVTVGDVVELHGFSDASRDAYAAVVYARVVDSEGKVHVSLISGKTKVAPINQISIPRLELCGAVLVTRLLTEISTVMNINKNNLHAWTDSTVVLAWLNSHPNRWNVFVANRVSEIISNLDSHHWAHVSTKCNPADAASRGQSPSELVKNTMWFNGPEFLQKENIEYKKPKDIGSKLEERVKAHCAAVNEALIERFSSLTRMVRVMAYCKRFFFNSKQEKSLRQVGYLTKSELNEAMNCCIRKCQVENFSEEFATIKKKENLPKRSSLRTLNPFLDDEGILRVGGRLEHSQLSTNQKHPIIIPKESHLTNLLILDAHKQTLHGGPQLMLCYLRNKFCILGAARLIKSCYRKCVACVKNTGKTQTQLMGQLPSARITPARAFKSSGVDLAGPIQIRTAKGRGHQSHKGYICLFVCMVTRAIHLEVVTALTTEAFLQAFKRFVSRRGYCSEIWSDNATNFTGASSELKRLFKNEKNSMHQEICESLATNGCKWNFIPSRSPNFGGLWEAGVKSVKYHLKRVIGQSTLTYEEMSTVLAQVEACLNSRPLSAAPGNEDGDAMVLTPGHFLVGEALVTPPDNNFESSNIGSLRRWQYTQRMIQDFWRQWSKQYLSKFYKRYKWTSTMPHPRVGDLVVVREDGLPACRWLYGRVIATHPGQDNLVRVVTLKIKNGTVKRPVNKLCLLPISTT